MKKSILLFGSVVSVLSLVAFGIMSMSASINNNSDALVSENVMNTDQAIKNRTNNLFTDFIYDVGPRFGPVTREDLKNVRFFQKYIGKEHAQRIVSYKSISVIIMKNDELTDVKEIEYGNELNDVQLAFMQAFDYSTNFMIRADYIEKNKNTGNIEESSWTPHLTLVPAKQAEFLNGKDALKKFLREKCKDQLDNVDPEKLLPAKLYFTVTKNGTIENARLDRPSGYPEIDRRMIELILNSAEKWNPAENTNGEKVDQELVVSFGLRGC